MNRKEIHFVWRELKLERILKKKLYLNQVVKDNVL